MTLEYQNLAFLNIQNAHPRYLQGCCKHDRCNTRIRTDLNYPARLQDRPKDPVEQNISKAVEGRMDQMGNVSEHK